jgi:dephospho-CoA kinase
MILVGLTGSLGSGKSTVANMFHRLGAHIIDADAMVHESLKPGGSCYVKVAWVFGDEIFEGRQISRRKLADIVFRRPKQLKKLMSIIHPEILKEVHGKIRKLKKDKKARLVVIDAPLLIEAGWYKWVDYLIVVKAPKELSVRRVMAQRNLSRSEVLRRMKAQMPTAQKISMADIVIDNKKNLNETRKTVEKIVRVLKNRM